jgi:hypothetical protein
MKSESEILHNYFSQLGKKSATARMKKIPAKKRSRIASAAAKARWAKAKKEQR